MIGANMDIKIQFDVSRLLVLVRRFIFNVDFFRGFGLFLRKSRDRGGGVSKATAPIKQHGR